MDTKNSTTPTRYSDAANAYAIALHYANPGVMMKDAAAGYDAGAASQSARIAELEEFCRYVDRINGSTGGLKAVLDEFKFRARSLLAKKEG